MSTLMPDALRPRDRGPVYVLGLLSAVKALGLLLLAEALSVGIVSVIAGTDQWHWAIALGCAAAILRAFASWATQSYAARTAIGIKERTRRELADRVIAGGLGERSGSLATLATHGLDELDSYFTSVIPAVTNAAVIPLLVGARILFADWVSALIIVLTVPLVPVFMALIGARTRDEVDAASSALARLSNHLVELARGLPVLVGLGRAEEQTVALERISTEYRVRTMRTLRTAFLSSLALELIATISVAVVAVFIGLRLITGQLPLEIGLLVLILAPECFAPFRELGASFHASRDGIAALEKAQQLVAVPTPDARLAPSSVACVRELTVRYDGRTDASLTNLTAVIHGRGVTAVTGRSGAGKSTLLGVLAGSVAEGVPGVIVTGSVLGVDPERIAWAPQHPHTIGDTVRAELLVYANGLPVDLACERVDELMQRFSLSGAADPASCSPGELRRLAIARALLRVDAGADLVLLDEPTAHLDGANARVVIEAIRSLAARVAVVVASHDPAVIALAGNVIALGRSGVSTSSPQVSVEPETAPTPIVAMAESPTISAISTLAGILRPTAGRLLAAALLGTLATLFAVSLTAVSGWLIVRASEHVAIMFLMVAIVGVRFFGVGRAALRYAERLVTHDAAFDSVTRMRTRLWRSLAARGPASRSLLQGGTALDYLVVTADAIRDRVPRVVMPPVVALLSSAAVITAVAMLHAPATPIVVACVIVGLLVAPATALLTDRAASASTRPVRAELTRRFTALVAAAPELRANGVGDVAVEQVAVLDARAAELAKRAARARGLGSAIVIAACCSASVLVLITRLPQARCPLRSSRLSRCSRSGSSTRFSRRWMPCSSGRRWQKQPGRSARSPCQCPPRAKRKTQTRLPSRPSKRSPSTGSRHAGPIQIAMCLPGSARPSRAASGSSSRGRQAQGSRR